MPDLELIITAANAAQARGYEFEIQQRRAHGLFEIVRDVRIAPDPEGIRAGSGTATLLALSDLLNDLRKQSAGGETSAIDALRGRRVLVLHSGGDSRRLPAYAAHGKLFAPLPCVDRPHEAAALFDLIIEDLASINWPSEGGVVIASGDVLLGLARHRPAFDAGTPAILVSPGSIERAERHGVLIIDRQGRVMDALQKPSEATLRARGAIGATNQALIDLGVLFVPWPTVVAWLDCARHAGLLQSSPPTMDLYAEAIPAMVGIISSNHQPRCETFLRGISGGGLRAIPLPNTLFAHIGSSRELLELLTSDHALGEIGCDRLHHWTAPSAPQGERTCCIASMVPDGSRLQGMVVIESCDLRRAIRLPGENIVVGVPAEHERAIELPRGCGLVCLPVESNQWAAIAFGIDDDFKTTDRNGGTFAGRLLATLDARVWNADDDRTLWSARLWRIGKLSETIDHACAILAGQRVSLSDDLVSCAQVMRQVNHQRLMEHRHRMAEAARQASLVSRINSAWRLCAETDAAAIASPADASRLLRLVAKRCDVVGSSPGSARLLRFAHAIVQRFPEAATAWPYQPCDLAAATFEAVARGVPGRPYRVDQAARAAIAPGQWVRASAPVRVDLAGGWSDTPPICNDVGGAVVNIAVRLDGVQPLQVSARLIDEPLLRIRSVDLRKSIDIHDSPALRAYDDPRDWAALPKAALALSGIATFAAAEDLRDRLRALSGGDGGLELTLNANLPKGSGLGASSILGAATLGCLADLVGETLPRDQLITRTSALEQIMSTAGGWQDQAGGLTGGAKLLTTSAGVNQVPVEHALTIPADFWRERVLLYSTGVQRLARDILQKVVWRWLGGGPEIRRIVRRLREGAYRMRECLEVEDMDGFTHRLLEFWELKKAIDPGATTPFIESLIERVKPQLSAWELPGAGGGGFLFMIARHAAAARRVREQLTADPPNAAARFFEVEIDDVGLTVVRDPA